MYLSNKVTKREEQGKGKTINSKYNLHKITFDDSYESSRSDIPNVFLKERDESPKKNYQSPKKEKDKPILKKLDSQQQLGYPIQDLSSNVKKSQEQGDDNMEIVDDEEIAQGEQIMDPNTSLSVIQTLKLYLGQFLFKNGYPMKKMIYINNNNEDQNQINRKEHENKYNNEKPNDYSFYNNSISVSSLILPLAILVRTAFTYLYVYLWIAVIVLLFLAESFLLPSNMQYTSNKAIYIVLLVLLLFINAICEFVSVRKRRNFKEHLSNYKVYHHNGHLAEWVSTKAIDIKPGQIYKINQFEYFPTDCVLLHSLNSLVNIGESHLVSQLVEHPSQNVMKETTIRQENIYLPLSGCLMYEITNPEYTDFQIIGKLTLQQPKQISYEISVRNIIKRGSINHSKAEIVCLAMETGIDSLSMKHLQYPFLHRHNSQSSQNIDPSNISNEDAPETVEFENSLIGAYLERKVQTIILVLILMYLILSGIGIISYLLFTLNKTNEFYLGQSKIQYWKIAIYHITNFIIIVPIFLQPIFKLYVSMSGALAESKISSRYIQILKENDTQKRYASSSSIKNEDEVLDHKKAFPVQIKDYNILNQLAGVDTIVTTIDTFRDQSAFTLHSIRVKQLNHNFMTGSLDSEIYSLGDVELIKYFMSVSLLTTINNHESLIPNYDLGIETAAKKYLELKKNKSAKEQILVNGDQFRVKHLLTISPTQTHPYKVVFLQPISQQVEESSKVLVLVRGNTQTILDKVYGNDIKLTEISRKLIEEKGFHVELIAKTTLHMKDFEEIEKAYHSASIEKSFFYKNLDRYINRVEPMGLLIFVNQFYQKKIDDSLRNPVLNKSLIHKFKQISTNTYKSELFGSQSLPKMIIIAPLSKSEQPEFESIHTITNLLINPYLFSLHLGEVSDKILHERPVNLEKMINQLEKERILVLNGWDQRDIIYSLQVLKKYGKRMLLYIEKDEYMYLMKQLPYAIKGSQKGFDNTKYSDIVLSSKSSLSYLYLVQLIRYDSVVVRQGIINIILTQVSKAVYFFTIEMINIFYTRGTGLAVINSQFYCLVQIILVFDVLFYLNWKYAVRAQTFDKKSSLTRQIWKQIIWTVFQAVYITFICIYSLETPGESSGAIHSYQFTTFIIVFVFIHILIFQKLFFTLSGSCSIYKLVVVAFQILIFYIGMIIISIVETYYFKAILWSALRGKTLLTAFGCVWISITFCFLKLFLNQMKTSKERRSLNKKLLKNI